MKTALIDTHCHLDMEAFDKDREEVIKKAKGSDVQFIINAGSDREGNLKGLDLSDKYKNIYSAVGIHPHDAKTLDEKLFKEVKEWARLPKVVAVGEIGLDYHYLHSTKGVQIEAFRRQIALANNFGLPILVHSREAKKDTLRILQDSTVFQGI